MAWEKVCGIYCIENKIDGKKYIGQSVDIYKRWNSHKNAVDKKEEHKLYKAMKEYGLKNFSFYILEKCSSNELNQKEIQWIEKLNTCNDGYNIYPGGGGCKGKVYTDEEKEKCRQISQAHGLTKPIIQLDLDGKLVNRWISIAEAIRNTKYWRTSISSCLHKVNPTAYGYIWIFEYEYEDFSLEKHYEGRGREHLKRKVNQYDLSMKLIKQWDSMLATEKEGFGGSLVSACCKGKRRTHKGYIWRYAEEDISDFNVKEFLDVKQGIPVHQYDMEGNYIKTHENITKANETLCLRTGTVSGFIHKKQVDGGGFLWSLDYYDKLPNNIIEQHKNKQKKSVRNLTTGEIFDSIKSAAESININYNSISDVCKGKCKTCGGYEWAYA